MSNEDFKAYQKGFGYKRFNRLLKLQRKYRVLPNRPGWEQTPDGLMPPPTPVPGQGGAVNRFWNLTVSTDNPGNITLDAGTILQKANDIATQVSITNITTEQTPAAGDVLFLEFTSTNPTSCTVELESTWTDHPSRYEIDTTPAFVAYREPLWYFTSDSTSGTLISENVYAVRVCSDYCFEVIHTLYEESATSKKFVVPKLIPSHQALPSTIAT